MRAYRRISTELHALIEETGPAYSYGMAMGSALVRCSPAGSATRANITLKSRRHVPFTGATIIIRLANIVLRASAVVALAHTLLDVADARHRASDRQTRSPPRDATSNVRWAV